MLCSLPRSSAVKALSLNVGFNPTSPYINEKEKCPLMSLQDKPTLTPKVFSNSLLQHLIIYCLERKTHTSKPTRKKCWFYFINFYDNRLRPLSIVSIATIATNNRLLYIVTNIAALGFSSLTFHTTPNMHALWYSLWICKLVTARFMLTCSLNGVQCWLCITNQH